MQASVMHPCTAFPAQPRPVARRRPSARRRRRMLTLALLFMVLVVTVVLVVAPHKVETLPRTEAPGVITYTVASGDTLWAIAETHSSGQDIRQVIDAIKQTNHLQTATVQPGQALLIPTPKH